MAVGAQRDQAIATGNFHEQPIARITPLCEQMGSWPSVFSQKEFWWEREWRSVGNVYLPQHGVIWLCPEGEGGSLGVPPREPTIDPRWGLEQIIAHLAGFSRADVTPFG